MVVAAARTPQGRLKGSLAALTAVELGAVAARAAIERSGLSADAVDAVVLGQVLQAGAGQNPARQTAAAAGVGWDVPAATVNKVCLSGLTAVIDGARMIRSGEAEVVLVGGQESMTNAPHLLPGSRAGFAFGDATLVDAVARDGLTDAFDHTSMASRPSAPTWATCSSRARSRTPSRRPRTSAPPPRRRTACSTPSSPP